MKIQSRNNMTIRLSKERINHIITNHPEMEQYLVDITKVITDPDIIFQGLQGEYVAIKARKSFFLVVVYKEQETDGFVITAFKTRSIQYLLKRNIIWRKN